MSTTPPSCSNIAHTRGAVVTMPTLTALSVLFRSTSENAFVSHSELAKKIKRRAFELLRIEQFDMKQG